MLTNSNIRTLEVERAHFLSPSRAFNVDLGQAPSFQYLPIKPTSNLGEIEIEIKQPKIDKFEVRHFFTFKLTCFYYL